MPENIPSRNFGRRVALVTGVSGFIGSHLCVYLLQEGWQVHGLHRPDSHMPALPDFQNVALHAHDGSVSNLTRILSEVQPTVVFHLASLFLSEHTAEDVDRLIRSNVQFGAQLLEAMQSCGIRHLVNTGTSWQHYEDKIFSPVNLYAATKQAFEAILQYYVEAHDLRAITLKLFDTYGVDDPRPKLMNLLKRIAADPKPLEMSPGEQLIDLVHISDVVRAYSIAVQRLLGGDVTGHEAYAVSSRQAISLRALVQLIEQVLGRPMPIRWAGRAYRRREVMQPWQGPTLPGWMAKVDLAQEIRRIFAELK